MDPNPLHIFLVDDDPRFRSLTALGLSEHGFVTTVAEDGEGALSRLLGPASGYSVPDEARQAGVDQDHAEIVNPDVVLLDIMMPGKTGWNVLQELRGAELDVPIIIVTARESVEERVRGLQMGADDYIIKPFAFAELLARIEAVVRRRSAVPVLRFGPLLLNPLTRQLRVGSRRVDLSPKEFDVMRVLLEHPDTVQSRADLLKGAWNTTQDPGTNIVEVHVGRVRKKLESVGCHFLRTVRGQGYILEDPGT